MDPEGEPVEVKYAVVTKGDGERVTLPDEQPDGVS